MFLFFDDGGVEKTISFIEEKLALGLWSWDLASGTMVWSPGQSRLAGLRPGETAMTYERLMALLHPEDRHRLAELSESLAEGFGLDCEYRIILPSGRVRWLTMRAETLFDASGMARRAVGLTFDITMERGAQRGVEHKELFCSCMSCVAPVVWSAGPDGSLTDMVTFFDENGRNPGVQDGTWQSVVHPEDLDATLDAWSAAVTARDLFDVEHRLCLSGQAGRSFRTLGVPHCAPDGAFLGWKGVCIDLSERKTRQGNKTMTTGAQIRAARGILRWSVADLAAAAQVSSGIIRRIEDYDGPPARANAAIELLRRALTKGGVDFMFPIDGRPAVRPSGNRPTPQPSTSGHLGKSRVPAPPCTSNALPYNSQ